VLAPFTGRNPERAAGQGGRSHLWRQRSLATAGDGAAATGNSLAGFGPTEPSPSRPINADHGGRDRGLGCRPAPAARLFDGQADKSRPGVSDPRPKCALAKTVVHHLARHLRQVVVCQRPTGE
jgi:hypothetical protein